MGSTDENVKLEPTEQTTTACTVYLSQEYHSSWLEHVQHNDTASLLNQPAASYRSRRVWLRLCWASLILSFTIMFWGNEPGTLNMLWE